MGTALGSRDRLRRVLGRRLEVADMRETAIETACGHLGAAISQSAPSDDQIIMDHVKAACELLKLVRTSDRASAVGDRDDVGEAMTAAYLAKGGGTDFLR